MSLRVRLFLLFGGLLALLLLAAWWWVRTLTEDLSTELGAVAFSVGRSVVGVFLSDEVGAASAGPQAATPSPCRVVREVVLSEADASGPGGDRGAGDTEPPVSPAASGSAAGQHTVRVERHLMVDEGGRPPDLRQVTYRYRFSPPPGGETQCVEQRVEVMDEAGVPGAGKLRELVCDEIDEYKVLALKLEPRRENQILSLEGDDLQRSIPVPREGVDRALRRFSGRLVLGSFALLGLGLLGAAVVAHRVTAPLRRLGEAAREVGAGALGTQVASQGGGEVAAAIDAFNLMSRRLEQLDRDARALRARRHLGELGEVARGFAHSLRNPLNALGLSVEELAARSSGENNGPELVASARRQIRRVDASVRSFLALASGGGATSDVDVLCLVQDVVLEALQESREEVRLRVKETEEELPRLCGVAPELRAVIQVLVVNAVEASPSGGQVEIRLTAAGSTRVRLEIDDEGPGLPPEVRERLFTPHVSTKPSGSGMGLFLAHRIATTRYGGSLELEDRAGGGTRAVLELGPRKSNDE